MREEDDDRCNEDIDLTKHLSTTGVMISKGIPVEWSYVMKDDNVSTMPSMINGGKPVGVSIDDRGAGRGFQTDNTDEVKCLIWGNLYVNHNCKIKRIEVTLTKNEATSRG